MKWTFPFGRRGRRKSRNTSCVYFPGCSSAEVSERRSKKSSTQSCSQGARPFPSEPELLGIAALAEELGQVRAVEVEAYHPLGVSKAHRLGLEGFRETAFAPPELVMRRVAAIASATRVPVRKI